VVQYAQQPVGVGAGSVVKRQRYQLGLVRFLNDVAQAIPETDEEAAHAEHGQRRTPRYCRHNFIPFDLHTMRMRVPAPLALAGRHEVPDSSQRRVPKLGQLAHPQLTAR
jgi:hypothetical protein